MKSTKEIIKEMEKAFNEFVAEHKYSTVVDPALLREDDVKSFINKSIRTLLESFGEETVGRDRDEVIGNETYINTIIENQLRAEQRLKVKEIITNIT